MGLDVYFRRDIANVLRATAYTSDGSMDVAAELLGDAELVRACQEAGIPVDKLLQVYRRAVRNTLISVGIAFGLEPVGSPIQPRSGGTLGPVALLWAEVPQER